VGLPEGMQRLSPTVEYQRFRGQGYKPTAVMREDPKGDYIDAGLAPAIRQQGAEEERERLKEAAIRGVTEITALDDPRAGDWPSIEVDHAKALVGAAVDRAIAALTDNQEAS
jgi:hypothetical protein